jgi:predicted transcriptional regulator
VNLLNTRRCRSSSFNDPKPMAELTLRLPQSLKERVQRLADEEGVSMNQFVALATAEKAASLESASADWQRQVLQAWAKEGEEAAEEAGHDTPAGYLQSLLDRAPDVEPPRKEDRLPSDQP